VRKIHNTILHDRSRTAISIYTTAEIPVFPMSDITASRGVDNDAATSFGWAVLNVIDCGSDGIDEDFSDGNRLSVRNQLDSKDMMRSNTFFVIASAVMGDDHTPYGAAVIAYLSQRKTCRPMETQLSVLKSELTEQSRVSIGPKRHTLLPPQRINSDGVTKISPSA
jgi:hypothetical protein